MSIKKNIATIAAKRSNQVPAIVIDVLGSRCSVRLSSANGSLLRNLRYSGASPTIGQVVYVVYRGITPIVETSITNLEDLISSASTTTTTQIVHGGGSDSETDTPPGSTAALAPIQVIFTMEGTLSVGTKTLRIYNNYGASRTITKVFLSVSTAPTGAAIIVDINKGGTTIFTTQANRPQIAATAITGYSTTVEVDTWDDGEYLTFDIDQVGSTIPGSDLTVHILAA